MSVYLFEKLPEDIALLIESTIACKMHVDAHHQHQKMMLQDDFRQNVIYSEMYASDLPYKIGGKPRNWSLYELNLTIPWKEYKQIRLFIKESNKTSSILFLKTVENEFEMNFTIVISHLNSKPW